MRYFVLIGTALVVAACSVGDIDRVKEFAEEAAKGVGVVAETVKSMDKDMDGKLSLTDFIIGIGGLLGIGGGAAVAKSKMRKKDGGKN